MTIRLAINDTNGRLADVTQPPPAPDRAAPPNQTPLPAPAAVAGPLRDRPEVGRPASLAAGVAPLLLSATDLAQLLRVSVATVWRLRAAGKLPRPLTALGKQLVRWDADEVRRWVAAGMLPLRNGRRSS
jgi:predicted DNA-binding transcriptional regulator AlpA